MDIIKAHATKNLCYIKAQKMTPKGIVVHSTGANNPNLKRYVDAAEEVGANKYGNHWNQSTPGGSKICVHAFIGRDKNNKVRVAEILPLDICCWGVGKGKNGSYNYDPAYIQFEICEDALKDENYYRQAFSVAAEYCAHLCRKYNLPVENIVGHCEAYKKGYGSNHKDPEHWMKNFGDSMAEFRKRVSAKLNDAKTEICLDDSKSSNTNFAQIQDGDLVSIAENAVYYSGKAIPKWVKTQKWYVMGTPKGDRAVINKNESGTNAICSAVNVNYLTVVKKQHDNSVDSEKSGEKCPYRVKVTKLPLVIRKSGAKDSRKVGSITQAGVYTIVEEKVDNESVTWGKLKSGAGWIPLDLVDVI